jgi:hypothetical protein
MKKKNILSFLLLLLLAAGCTDEDYRNCPAGLYISFEPVNSKHNYPALVATVNLFFYDQQGNLKADFHYTRNQLHGYERAAFVPAIPDGDYRVVAVIKSGERHYETLRGESYETLHTKLKSATVTDKLTDLFSSEKNITINRLSPVIQYETMDIVKHNNNIRLQVDYDGYMAPNGVTLDACIEENNGEFHYQSYSSRMLHNVCYLPWDGQLGSNNLPERFELSSFRLFLGGSTSIRLFETNGSSSFTGRSFSMNVVNELIKVRNLHGERLYDTNLKLEYNDEYVMTITIGKDFVVLSVTIDNWDTIGGGTDL